VRVTRPTVTCRPNGGTYSEYGILGVLAVLALDTVVFWATSNQAAALVVGIAAGALCAWRIARMGMKREREELVVMNLFRTYRVPLRAISGYALPLWSVSLGKQPGVTLTLTSGGRVHARMVDYDAGGWLESQGVDKFGHKDASRPHPT
jgi:hypothetical protein